MQIKKKLPIVFNMLICISLLVLALVTYIYTTNSSIKKSKGNMKQLAMSEGKAIEAVVKANVHEMQLIASDERVKKYILTTEPNKNEKEDIRNYLQKSLGAENDYEICIINNLGEVLVSSSKEQTTNRISNVEAFGQVMKGQNVFENIIDATYNDGKFISITVPIKDEKENVMGAICKIISSRVINELKESIQVNENEYVYIVNQNLEVIAHPDTEKEGKDIESIALKKLISECKKSNKIDGAYTYTASTQKRYVSFYLLQDIGWVICIEQSIADMQKQAVVGSALIIATLIILMIMITIGSRRIVNQIITPIDMLIETMGCVAKGDLSYCTYDANDELGELSKHYNDMIKKLQESKEALIASEERMRKLTFFDELTGCLNKSAFIETVDEIIIRAGEHQSGVLLFIDLDNFKKINDVLSHDIGDKVLNYIAKKITEVLPQDTLVGRFGGDEFVIFKSLENGMEEVHEMIYNLLNLFQNKVALEEANKVHLTCSIGIALYPNDGKDSSTLLKNADTAMYKVKETGKNSYSFYTKAMSQQLDRKLLVEEAVREAIGKDSFYFQYQPVVELRSGYTTGCEALIRLIDDKLGFISPGEFIPIAEETGLIIETGDWVLEKALTTLKELHDKGYNQFTMNINVSSVQIKEEDFVEKLSEAIQKVGVLPQCIKLEVTESVVMEQVEKSIELFNQIKTLGIKIALDDFGTGYSSLNYLRSIPFDILKIDKSFVDEITTSKELSQIVDSIIGMAHALNIVVVAEGVEDEMQLEVLRRKGCDYIPMSLS